MMKLQSLVGWTKENAVGFLYGLHLDNFTQNGNQTDFKEPFKNRTEAIWSYF